MEAMLFCLCCCSADHTQSVIQFLSDTEYQSSSACRAQTYLCTKKPLKDNKRSSLNVDLDECCLLALCTGASRSGKLFCFGVTCPSGIIWGQRLSNTRAMSLWLPLKTQRRANPGPKQLLLIGSHCKLRKLSDLCSDEVSGVYLCMHMSRVCGSMCMCQDYIVRIRCDLSWVNLTSVLVQINTEGVDTNSQQQSSGVVTLNQTQWLYVAHIDEFFSFTLDIFISFWVYVLMKYATTFFLLKHYIAEELRNWFLSAQQ